MGGFAMTRADREGRNLKIRRIIPYYPEKIDLDLLIWRFEQQSTEQERMRLNRDHIRWCALLDKFIAQSFVVRRENGVYSRVKTSQDIRDAVYERKRRLTPVVRLTLREQAEKANKEYREGMGLSPNWRAEGLQH
jgi:hypothetical protein